MKKIYAAIILCIIGASVSVSAQAVFPYYETFDTFPAYQPLNGHGRLVASSHVQVYPRGINGSNCAEFQMTPSASPHFDTISSPLIGPLTGNSAASFYFRAVTYTGSTPQRYVLTGGDKIEVFVGNSNWSFSSLQYTITSSNQNPTAAYLKVVVGAPNVFAGASGRFRIVVSNPNAHDWLFELDSLVVRDTLAPVLVPPTLTDSVSNVKCRAQSNGSIKVMASGAHAPYTYLWNTGSTTDTISMRPAGAYSVIVTDSLGAIAMLTDTIHEPALTLLADSLSKLDVACHGEGTGAAAIYVSGGTQPYHYHWNTNPAGGNAAILNQTAGIYNVTVTDANSCSLTATVRIAQPVSALTVTTSTTPSSGHNGTATASPNGGTSPYSFVWVPTNPSQTGAIATGLGSGQYAVYVTDARGCVVIDTVSISPSGIDEVSKDVKLYPNPAKDYLRYHIEGRQGEKPTVTCIDMMGRYTTLATESDHTIMVGTLPSGIYTIQIQTSSHVYSGRIVIER